MVANHVSAANAKTRRRAANGEAKRENVKRRYRRSGLAKHRVKNHEIWQNAIGSAAIGSQRSKGIGEAAQREETRRRRRRKINSVAATGGGKRRRRRRRGVAGGSAASKSAAAAWRAAKWQSKYTAKYQNGSVATWRRRNGAGGKSVINSNGGLGLIRPGENQHGARRRTGTNGVVKWQRNAAKSDSKTPRQASAKSGVAAAADEIGEATKWRSLAEKRRNSAATNSAVANKGWRRIAKQAAGAASNRGGNIESIAASENQRKSRNRRARAAASNRQINEKHSARWQISKNKSGTRAGFTAAAKAWRHRQWQRRRHLSAATANGAKHRNEKKTWRKRGVSGAAKSIIINIEASRHQNGVIGEKKKVESIGCGAARSGDIAAGAETYRSAAETSGMANIAARSKGENVKKKIVICCGGSSGIESGGKHQQNRKLGGIISSAKETAANCRTSISAAIGGSGGIGGGERRKISKMKRNRILQA